MPAHSFRWLSWLAITLVIALLGVVAAAVVGHASRPLAGSAPSESGPHPTIAIEPAVIARPSAIPAAGGLPRSAPSTIPTPAAARPAFPPSGEAEDDRILAAALAEPATPGDRTAEIVAAQDAESAALLRDLETDPPALPAGQATRISRPVFRGTRPLDADEIADRRHQTGKRPGHIPRGPG